MPYQVESKDRQLIVFTVYSAHDDDWDELTDADIDAIQEILGPGLEGGGSDQEIAEAICNAAIAVMGDRY